MWPLVHVANVLFCKFKEFFFEHLPAPEDLDIISVSFDLIQLFKTDYFSLLEVYTCLEATFLTIDTVNVFAIEQRLFYFLNGNHILLDSKQFCVSL